MPTPVSLFVTCIVDAVHPEIGEAVLAVLERLGHEVSFPPAQTCCGLPLYNNGFVDEAREVARHTVLAMRGPDAEPVIVPSGSCAWMLRTIYPELLGEEGARFAARVFELSEFVVERAGPLEGLRLAQPETATYHPSCHLRRGLRVVRPPLKLLESIEGLTLAPLPRDDECCGFGGTFAVRQPGLSSSMLQDKLANVTSTGATTLVVSDPGCLLQLADGASAAGCPVAVRHLAEILADALSEDARRKE
jgi:L-lactate dehydrogenase complex protein LldE